MIPYHKLNKVEDKKKMLHMLILNITISKAREIKSIDININDNLIMYLNNEGEASPDNGGVSPSSLLSRRKLKINPADYFL